MEILTDRELTIVKLMAQGLDNKQIAAIIHVSKHTVKAHVSTIIRKLDAKNRTNAVYVAVLKSLIEVEMAF